MKLLSPNDFFAETMGGRPNMMDVSIYEGYPFECACGQIHSFSPSRVNIVRELPGRRLVFECPEEPNFATCVKLKGILRFKGFVSLFGTRVEEDMDVMDTLKASLEKRLGVNLEDT